ncbi:MAG: hypothetical protein LBU66_03320 [Treponema sp.]|jgi:hypothetical protein|nr:hypothetical protein [Treponema sp.]
MKKIVIMLIAVMLICGNAFTQVRDDFNDLFDAVMTESTESRYSGGAFGSDVDDYINPAFYDPEIGTFFFMGGKPAGSSINIDAATPILNSTNISFGFGKTLGRKTAEGEEDSTSSGTGYLGLYYGGSFVDAKGGSTAAGKDDKAESAHDATWRNRLAILYGTGSMGLRFDFIMPDTNDAVYFYDNKLASHEITNAPSLALGFGTIIGGDEEKNGNAVWATLGFKFPDALVITDFSQGAEEEVKKSATILTGAILGIKAGGLFELDEASAFLGEIYLNAEFPGSASGDKDVLGMDPFTAFGEFGIGLYTEYQKALVFGPATVKFMPNMYLDFTSKSNDVNVKNVDKKPADNDFMLTPGITVGAEYRHDKIAIYSALGLRFFQWDVYNSTGGKNEKDYLTWEFKGIAWDTSMLTSTNNYLGFGITFTPIEGLVFGAGITAPIGINPMTMRLESATGSNAMPGGIYSGLTSATASITASYKY